MKIQLNERDTELVITYVRDMCRELNGTNRDVFYYLRGKDLNDLSHVESLAYCYLYFTQSNY